MSLWPLAIGERLARPADPEADCPLTGFLNGLICGDYRADLRAASVNISANLPAADLIFTPDGAISVPLFHELMAVPGEIELSQVALGDEGRNPRKDAA